MLGTGLGSIPAFEQQELGTPFVGPIEVIEVRVQLGLVGLILIWSSLIARARSKLPLLVMSPCAFFNGALEYGAPLVVALLLAASPDVGKPS